MPEFAYRAIDRLGKESSGTLTADTRAAALSRIVQLGSTPVQIQEQQSASKTPVAVNGAPKRVSAAQVESFTLEMANLLAAGVPLSRAMTIVIREASNQAAKAQWKAIHDDVLAGSSLADSMAKYPRAFPSVYVAMVRAGETGGFLDLVLTQISEFQNRERDLMGKVKAALVYPCVLAVMAVGVVIFLMTFFIPRFSGIFKDFGGSLPWLTQVIIAISDAIMKHGLIVLVFVSLLFLFFKRLLNSEAGRRRIEHLVLRTPLLGQVVARFALIRFFRMLGTLVGSGVGLISALRVAKEAIGNQTLTDTVGVAVEDVQNGASLSGSLAKGAQLFPSSVVEMVAIAEETGRLDKELVRISISFESDLDRRMRMLVALAEPLLLFVMAAIIGTIVVGMLLPLFELQELIH